MTERSRRRILAFFAAAVGSVVLDGCTPVRASPPTRTVEGEPAATPEIPPKASSTAILEPTANPPSIATPESTPELADLTPIAAAGTAPKRLVGYLPSWMIGKDYAVADVPVTRLTHLIYAFAAIAESGECVVADQKVDPAAFRELRRLPKTTPPLRTSISVGGAGGSKRFPLVAQTTEARQKFAKSCVTFINKHGFEGIDLDWEFPAGEDQRRNFTLLLEELRGQLDAAGATRDSRYVLTVAAPAGPAHYSNLELDRISAYVDWINLMTYAFHGTWSTITNFNAPLFASSTDPSSSIQRIIYNTDAAVQAYAAAGIPVDKIVVGVPFYGYGWKGVPDVNHGLYQSSNGLPPGTLAPGVFTYRDLKKRLVGTYQRYWHEEAQVPWLYDPQSRVMISYDDEVSVGGKADYVRARGLGGVMIWELTADDLNHTLVTAIHDHLNLGT